MERGWPTIDLSSMGLRLISCASHLQKNCHRLACSTIGEDAARLARRIFLAPSSLVQSGRTGSLFTHPGTDSATYGSAEPWEGHELRRSPEFATSWLFQLHASYLHSGQLHHQGRLHHLDPRLANEDAVVKGPGKMKWQLHVTRPSPA